MEWQHFDRAVSGDSDRTAVSARTKDILNIKYKKTFCLIRLRQSEVCCIVELLRAFIFIIFDFCVMLQSIFMKLHTIVWNTYGYLYRIIFYSVKVYTCIKIFSRVSIFLGHIVYIFFSLFSHVLMTTTQLVV